MSLHPVLFVFTSVFALLAIVGTSYIVFLGLVGLLSFKSDDKRMTAASKTRFLILIPAHDEELGIGPTLESIRSQNYPGELRNAIVVADNCRDHTSMIVRRAGFECWERTEPNSPGKGHALRWALDRLASDPGHDAIVFIDADTRIDSEFLAMMDREIQKGAPALQGRYEFELAEASDFSILTFASKRAENVLFWRPRERFGWMGFIVGNGFCLRRETLDTVPWAAYSIVEDVEYSVQLALRGVRVQFVESAQVISRATRRVADAAPQRLRWASGTVQVIRNYVPQLVRAAIKRRSLRCLEMALALSLTSRFSLIYLILLASGVSVFLGPGRDSLFVRAVIVSSALLFCVYVAMVMAQVPKGPGARMRAVGTLPFYLVWMVFVHAGAAIGIRRKVWVRTTR